MQSFRTFLCAAVLFGTGHTAAAQPAPEDAAQPTPEAAPQPTPEAPPPDYEDRVLRSLTAQPGGLTADDAAVRASTNNPSVQARRIEVELTRANIEQTLVRYVPRIGVSAGVTRTNTTDFNFGAGGFSVGAFNAGQLSVGPCPGSGGDCVLDAAGQPVGAIAPEPFTVPRNNYRIDVNVAVPFSDYLFSLPSARKAARSEVSSKQRAADAERARVELDARIAYYEWLRAVAQVAVAERALASTTTRLEDARLGLAGGTLAPADVLQIESAVASASVGVQSAKNFETLARHNLAVMMGESDIDYKVGESVLADVEPLATHGSLNDLVAHGRKHRAEVRALVDSSTAIREGKRGASADLYPRLDGVASVTYANPNPAFFPPEGDWDASWSIGLTVSWGLDSFLQTRTQRKQLDANRRLLDVQRAAIERGVALEVTAAWQAWQRAQASLDQSGKALEAAQAAHDQRVALFRGGEATTSEIVEAELQWHNATMLLVNARIDVRIARARLLHAAALPHGGAR